MIIPCENPCIVCDPIPLGAEGIFPNPNSEANPFSNFSSEAPDRIIFISRNYTPVLGDPPLGTNWTSTGCVGLCISFISQEDADLCAARQGVLCIDWPQNPQVPPGQPPDACITNPSLCPTPPAPVFASAAQQCSVQCPDGSFFNFTTVAGLFLELSQQLANDKSYSWACQKASQNSLCFGSLSQTAGCTTESFSSFIEVSSVGNRAVTFAIIAGSLPPGLSPSQSNPYTIFYTGTPASGTGGTYPFTLRATDALGNVIQKNFIINIVGITTTSPLPNATLNSAYSTQLMSEGPVGNEVWTVAVGSLPPGLTLDSASGVISGTPTTAGVYDFQIRMDTTGI